MTQGKLRAAFFFYRQYASVLLLLTAMCCVVYRASGDDAAAAIMCKVFTDLLVLYFIRALAGARLYYYYNLHVPRAMLFAGLFLIDLLPFSISLWISHHLS